MGRELGPQRVLLLGLAAHDVASLEPGERRQSRQRDDPAAGGREGAGIDDEREPLTAVVADDAIAVAERLRDPHAGTLVGAATDVAILLQAEKVEPLAVAELEVLSDERVEPAPVHEIVCRDDDGRLSGHQIRDCLMSSARRDR